MIYKLNYDKQNEPLCRLKLSMEKIGLTFFVQLNQGLIRVPTALSQLIRVHFIKLWEPAIYSPITPPSLKITLKNIFIFRNVGRLLGLCLLQNELCPLFLNRHVLKVKFYSFL